MKLESPEFKSCFNPNVRCIEDLFKQNAFEIRIAGKAVRDLLLGKRPSELEFATTATPEEMKGMFKKLNSITFEEYPGKQGTIIIKFNEKDKFKITTLQKEKTSSNVTEVEFIKDWTLDARNRDFTINAMFIDFDGTVNDFFEGYQDLKNQRVVFIGDVNEKIREDYMRILRYFRFYSEIAEKPDSHDQHVLEVFKKNADGLKTISGKKIWTELQKILKEKFSYEVLTLIINLGLGPSIGLPEKCNLLELYDVWKRIRENDYEYAPITLLAALFTNLNEFENFKRKAELPDFEAKLGNFIIQYRKEEDKDSLRPYTDLIFEIEKQEDVPQLVFIIKEFFKYKGRIDLLKDFKIWPTQVVIASPQLKKAKLENSAIFQTFLEYLIRTKDFSIRNYCIECGLGTPPGNIPMERFDECILRNAILYNLCRRDCNLKPRTIYHLITFLQIEFSELTYQIRLQIMLHLSKLDAPEENLNELIATFCSIGKNNYSDEDRITKAPDDLITLIKTALKQKPVLMAILQSLNMKLKENSVSEGYLVSLIDRLNIFFSKTFTPLDGLRGCCLLIGVYLCRKNIANHSGTQDVFKADIITLATHEFVHFVFRSVVQDFNAFSPHKFVGGKTVPVFEKVLANHPLELGGNAELRLFDNIQPDWRKSSSKAARKFLERIQMPNCTLPVLKESEHGKLELRSRKEPFSVSAIDMMLNNNYFF